MVERPAGGGNGAANVLRHHVLCAPHAEAVPESFEIAGAVSDGVWRW
jgi:hypothetical protein